jgi:protein-tyrosine-phosphatase
MDAARILEWKVRDPIGLSEEIYRDVAKELERLVMALVNELR